MELMNVFRIFRLREPIFNREPQPDESMTSLHEIDVLNEEYEHERVAVEDAINSLGESTVTTPLTGAEAIRLFNSIHTQQNRTNFIKEELQESNSRPICRICRCDSTNLLIECPCKCKGSVVSTIIISIIFIN